MVRLGAYRAGSDPAVDEAVALAPRIEAMLRQARDERTGIEDSFALLRAALEPVMTPRSAGRAAAAAPDRGGRGAPRPGRLPACRKRGSRGGCRDRGRDRARDRGRDQPRRRRRGGGGVRRLAAADPAKATGGAGRRLRKPRRRRRKPARCWGPRAAAVRAAEEMLEKHAAEAWAEAERKGQNEIDEAAQRSGTIMRK